MNLFRIRQWIEFIIVLGAIVALILVWSGNLRVFPLSDDSYPYVTSVLSILIPTTVTFGVAALAIVFLTAQVSAAYGKPSVLKELYRSRDVYILFLCVSVNILAGYFALVLNTDLVITVLENRLLDSLLIIAMLTALLMLPIVMSQIENFDPLVLAAKLSSRINARDVKEYGLTHVDVPDNLRNIVNYSLSPVGIRPHRVDPFRPIHELIIDSVNTRDRVMFGKLFRYLLQPIPRAYNAYWDPEGIKTSGKSKKIPSLYRYDLEEKIHLSLAILHYAVKRAKNLLNEWNGLDIGRHGILTGIGDLISSLAPIKDSQVTIRLCLNATFHISKYYAGVAPYGRVEPLNAYFIAAQELFRYGKAVESNYCIEVLAWIAVHTKQLSPQRTEGIEIYINGELSEKYEEMKNLFLNELDRLPEDNCDPWNIWPNN
jgi:hypothetical protein